MPKSQVLVTITAEAVVDLPDGVEDVEAYCRERVSLDWGAMSVDRVVQGDTVSIAHFAIPESGVEPATDSAGEATEGEPVAESEGPLVDAARAIGSTLGRVAATIGDLAGGLVGSASPEGDESEESAVTPEMLASEHGIDVEEAASEGTLVGETGADLAESAPLVAGTAVEDEAAAVPVEAETAAAPLAHAAAATAGASSVDRDLTKDEVLALFTDPVYSDMIRSAVRERAERLVEAVVAEVIGELEPLLRRQDDRRRAQGL